jgi:hypothetical protein
VARAGEWMEAWSPATQKAEERPGRGREKLADENLRCGRTGREVDCRQESACKRRSPWRDGHRSLEMHRVEEGRLVALAPLLLDARLRGAIFFET